MNRRTVISNGLYSPAHEHDACGVCFVVDQKGRSSHRIVQLALAALANMDHRGAKGSEPNTGDGAGILMQIPHSFLRRVVGFELPKPGWYATGLAFLPSDPDACVQAVSRIEEMAAEEGLRAIGWRDVPVEDSMLGDTSRLTQPRFRQVFLACSGVSGMDLERRVFMARKRIEHEVQGVYFPSLSTRTMVYKGMLTSDQLGVFFADLTDPRVETCLALVHSRFSTNTFPSWPLAHPFRLISHNGEINTVQGNRNWMRAREAVLESAALPGDLKRILPVCTPGVSDSASFDEVLELLHMAGRSLPHAVLMMIPEAWENHESMGAQRRAFYQFHASLMEAWDGPASIAFSDGTLIGAVLDRNGFRPSRYWVTSDDLVIMASEVGVIDIDPGKVVRKGRLQPGRMFLVDTSKGRIVADEEIKRELAGEQPYEEWLHAGLIHFDRLPAREHRAPAPSSVLPQQQVFGYSDEDLRLVLAPMACQGEEPIGAMGNDAPLAVLSDRPRLLYDYFHQLFAQVTNPPLDAIREKIVTSLGSTLGPELNLLQPLPASCRQVVLPFPVIDNDELAKLVHINEGGDLPGFQAATFHGLYPVAGGGKALREAIEDIRARVSAAIADGARILVLSDRDWTAEFAPIPSLLLTAAVHHHLIRERTRTQVGLVVETGDAREVHHMAALIGYGAGAINPYLALETVEDLATSGAIGEIRPAEAVRGYITACGKGILKIMSKMGICTVASYTGAQVFEAIGLSREVIDEYFAGTVSRIEGIGLDGIAEETAARHRHAHPNRPGSTAHRGLEIGGQYQWRKEGEYHLANPETISKLQRATQMGSFELFREYSKAVDEQSERLATLRGLLCFKTGLRPSVPIDEVEPVSEIVKRFSTAAMSYGALSKEAHETLAVAMNRLGAKSNCGEGGEDPERCIPLPGGDSVRSAVRQVASARFGVTAEYLCNAEDLQIKMAQGAKPGEGGQLPGPKVYPWIARTRHSTAGVGLISPPPHHDIYSIEDIAQLIYDLKSSNPQARIHVKLVAQVGVGTVAAGVVKAHADVVLISGHDGGTGASPRSSIKHAGGPWELGLAETQQTLVRNGLRDRVVLQVDGQLKTGRDVVVGALLGAEEFAFGTAPLVVLGCVMMRMCNEDICPMGIATQNPELRKRFTGKAEHVVKFFEFLAQEVREYLAALGFRSIEEAVGHCEALDVKVAAGHWKASGLDLSPILAPSACPDGQASHRARAQDHGLDDALDNQLIALSTRALAGEGRVSLEMSIRNVNRAVGTMLGHEVVARHGGEGLAEDTISIHFRGSAGQSFGAFLPRGITLRLEGDANDYVGKGLSGGRIVLFPPTDSPFTAEQNVIAGNVILYGATSGEAFIRGLVGERFCVRNSGAVAVAEGVGDHACEYMTGGRVVVLGPTGRNFAAGMSGGIAYVHDAAGTFASKVNMDLVDLESCDAEEESWLHDLVARHRAETGSAVADRLLSDWRQAATRFVKVMPRDYKRALLAARDARERGETEENTTMEALRG